MALELSAIIADPADVAQFLMRDAGLWGVMACTGRRGVGHAARFDLTFDPLPGLKAAGFPVQHARITVLPDGAVLAWPRHVVGVDFLHRNTGGFRELCLEYIDDDPALRWVWSDGFEEYVTRVYRHLLFDEQWRRTGHWPGEDAPHGRPAEPYPIQSTRLRREARRWARAL